MDDDRKHEIEASIVRVMKSRKKMTVSEVQYLIYLYTIYFVCNGLFFI